MDFLGEGEFNAEIFEDGINASSNAQDYLKTQRTINSTETLTVKMASGGGWVARFVK